ncbi:uncharacterized protein LOC144139273 [Haemaphysalis longicornis]
MESVVVLVSSGSDEDSRNSNTPTSGDHIVSPERPASPDKATPARDDRTSPPAPVAAGVTEQEPLPPRKELEPGAIAPQDEGPLSENRKEDEEDENGKEDDESEQELMEQKEERMNTKKDEEEAEQEPSDDDQDEESSCPPNKKASTEPLGTTASNPLIISSDDDD